MMRTGIKENNNNKKQRTMKKFMYFMSFAVMTIMLSACSNDDADIQSAPVDERAPRYAILQFDCNRPTFDDEGTTRGTTDSWADGSKVYLQFMVGSGRVDGVATYTAATQEWSVF